MGEDTKIRTKFNGSLRVEARDERLTSDGGSIALREVLERLGMRRWLEKRLVDTRREALITHPLVELVCTYVFLLALGMRDQDDADDMRDDPGMRLAVSKRKGTSPLETREPEERERNKNPPHPDGLPSQPTLSRMMRTLAHDDNPEVIRDAVLELAARRVRNERGGHRQRYLTVDVDSLPVEVHGQQEGSDYNGHYHARIFHPIVASVGETGDFVDIRLRGGKAHTAEGALDFITQVVDRVEDRMCQVAAVRIDAGFPNEELLAGLEARNTPYVARVKNNAVLDRMAEPHLRRPPGRRPKEPRVWFHEMTYAAKSWSRERRVVLVVLERKDDLFLHHFWLITNWSRVQMPAPDLLEHYRQRGTAEARFGDFMDALRPALSSAPRPKTHYRGKRLPPPAAEPAASSFVINELILLLNVVAFNLLNVLRIELSGATGDAWSVKRVRERVLRVAARILVHGRRATIVVSRVTAKYWRRLFGRLRRLRPLET